MKRGGYVYILTNTTKSVLYVGVTSDLKNRVEEHRSKIDPHSFTAKYNCHILVYYEGFHHIEEAIVEERRIKGGSRRGKLDMLFKINPMWKDLYKIVAD